MKRTAIIAVTVLAAAAASFAAGKAPIWDFDRDRPGSVAAGFSSTVGQWQVKTDATAPSKPNVLAQLAKNSRDAFNLALSTETSLRDLDVRVKMRAIGGTTDQGGGLVWRARDSRNYYVARYNPLEGTYRLYKVHNYGLVQLASAEIMSVSGWHTLRVVMVGDHIECYLDGTKYLDLRDATFGEAGRIGLWTKADAQTYFDDLTVMAK
jgi:hypothetical protein